MVCFLLSVVGILLRRVASLIQLIGDLVWMSWRVLLPVRLRDMVVLYRMSSLR
jgi:hypothetical protein